MTTDQQRQSRIDRLQRCLCIMADAVESNHSLTPIFERVDAELAAELAGVSAVDRVRVKIRVSKLAA